MKIPQTPFSTCLSGSAKETELRLRSIFQWKKKRPPAAAILLTALVVLLCFGLVSCEPAVPQELTDNIERWLEEASGNEASDKLVREETRWVLEEVKRTNRSYELAGVRGRIYEIACRSENGALELSASLLVDPGTLEIIDVESRMIAGKEEMAAEPYPVSMGRASDLTVLIGSGAVLEISGYSTETGTVRYSLKNETKAPYYTGFLEPSIQILQDGTWYQLVYRTDQSILSYSAEGETLEPGGTYSGSTDFSRYGDAVPDGRYRLVVAVSDSPTGNRSYLAADFTVRNGVFVYEPENIPSATQIKEMKAERYASAIGPYDINGDGVLQTLEFPSPDPELFGLTGTDAALFSAVSDYIRQTLYIDPKDTMLLLSSVTVYGQYGGENGATRYVCGLWRGMDYDAGIHLAEGGAKFGSNWGGGGYLARVTLSADGSLLEVLPTLEGANNTARIYEICGPLTELAAEALRGSGAEGRDLAPRDPSIFTRYLGYYFPGTLAVQENIQDLLRHYMEEYSILVLDADEVTGMLDICLSDYRPEIMTEIKQLVEANYSRSDYLNFEDYTGVVNLTT